MNNIHKKKLPETIRTAPNMKATLSGCIGTPSKSVKNQASLFKETVSVTSSDPACKKDIA